MKFLLQRYNFSFKAHLVTVTYVFAIKHYVLPTVEIDTRALSF